jgi:hypothetical protein
VWPGLCMAGSRAEHTETVSHGTQAAAMLRPAGHVTRDMSLPLRKLARGCDECVTFMGVWRGPSSPVCRRIDIKVYPFSQLATAVNYFSSSEQFCRALRWGP